MANGFLANDLVVRIVAHRGSRSESEDPRSEIKRILRRKCAGRANRDRSSIALQLGEKRAEPSDAKMFVRAEAFAHPCSRMTTYSVRGAARRCSWGAVSV